MAEQLIEKLVAWLEYVKVSQENLKWHANQILALIEEADYVKLADGDKVISKIAWDLLSPLIQEGLVEEEKKAGWAESRTGEEIR